MTRPVPFSLSTEAFDRLNSVLDQVEDENSGVVKDPGPGLEFDGRMYPPREDFTEHAPDGRIFAATKGNTIEAQPDGTLTVNSRKTGEPVYHRAGAGGASAKDGESELEDPTIAEAFAAVRRAQQGNAAPGQRQGSEGSTPRRETPQSSKYRGPER